jgi:hypothetical protein
LTNVHEAQIGGRIVDVRPLVDVSVVDLDVEVRRFHPVATAKATSFGLPSSVVLTTVPVVPTGTGGTFMPKIRLLAVTRSPLR